jgi:hypothetical protein
MASEESHAEWHALFAPLPADALPRRQPVGSPEVLAGPHGWAIAGWEQLVLDLSAGAAGSRNVLVVLDPDGVLLSANDSVLYRTGPGGTPPPADCESPTVVRHESVGGRFEPDGSFRGTRWISVALDPGGADELDWESTPSAPSEEDIAALRLLVAEMIRRAPSGAGGGSARR